MYFVQLRIAPQNPKTPFECKLIFNFHFLPLVALFLGLA